MNSINQLGLAMPILLWLMALDELTGIWKGVYLRQLNSDIGVHGLMRKGGCIVLIVAVHIIQPLIPGAPALDNVFAGGFALFELLSIAENVGKIGVPLPPQLIGVLKAFGEGETIGKIVKSTTIVKSSDPTVPDVESKTVTLETPLKDGKP